MTEQLDNKAVKKIKPTSNKIQVSTKRDTGFYIFLAKLFLMDYEDIELHGLGDAISICVKVSETLVRHGYTTFKKIETSTLEPGKEDQDDRRRKKAKLIITLGKSAQFNDKIKDFKIQK